MGGTRSLEKCFITGLSTKNHTSDFDGIEYKVDVKENEMFFRFNWDHQNSSYVEENKHILHGIILNDKFPKEFNDPKGAVLDNKKLEKIIKDAIVPRTPESKINHLLNHVHSLQEYEGSRVKCPGDEDEQDLAKSLYFKNYQELEFYLFTLKEKGLVKGSNLIKGIQLTYEGLSRVIEINESGNQSNKCFVAMSFSKGQEETRDAIKRAIDDSSFEPILIDEQHIDSDVTINDAMMADIKKAKFLVADFTEHKHGVYFEAGFALGLKKPVIYLCKRKDFKKTHFDTNHYSHIVYETLDELTKRLKTKIEAWIK